ncbi:PTS N-acetylglucosamine transporter subunit IIABC [Enterococcus florum]|uniref:PTS N-acetylglucosamine transporter subunit IIABC n=1 Tax=Enterococcus florum TaxID=2480627 RepID=A0A4P5PA16_9ENTE|nr:PTS glucose transporter subunit IIA [Enterococcus florum]GCF94927.1 PTS N-acetylglucosamine transporter subunit IIABC [Enterococcus florum]
MFKNLFNKKKSTDIYQAVKGEVIPLSEVADQVFSQEMMGRGFAIRPAEGVIETPIEGVIDSVFPTKHAVTIKNANDVAILVHIGIDTVELNGEGLDILVKEGEKVTKGTQIAQVDFEAIKTNGKGTDVIFVFPELAAEKTITIITDEPGIVARID